MRIRIQLLGGLTVLDGENEPVRFGPQKPGALLARLAIDPGGNYPREELIELLWPDEDPIVTRDRFKQVLSELRRKLDPFEYKCGRFIVSDSSGVRLDASCITTDVQMFAACLQSAANVSDPSRRAAILIDAIETYSGELLPGHYEDWIGNERHRLADLRIDALCDLALSLAETGELGRAMDFVRRAIAADPVREQSHSLLMRLYAATGRKGEAMRQYNDLERILNSELGIQPSAEIQAMAAKLREGGDLEPFFTSNFAASATGPSKLGTSASKSSIPQPLTRFFGREEEMHALDRMLDHTCGRPAVNRLVTITGTGGCGKTRLATEAALRFRNRSTGCAWFVPLAEITEGENLAVAILSAMGIEGQVSREPWSQVVQALDDGPNLLVLDNFEQLIDTGATRIAELISRAPHTHFLVTSRHPLKLHGERELPLEPLSTPSKPGSPDRLLEFASIQLFADRARAVRPEFVVSDENAEMVATLCRRLDGIPLAIEIAAARSKIYSPEQMVTQLDNRFDFLRNPNRDAIERHRTLRAAIDWSYDLLEPDIQKLFARLSIFRGGWTLKAAVSVCGSGVGSVRLLRWMEELRDWSMITSSEVDNEMRLGMLETLREYAAELLPTSEYDLLCSRHADWFLQLAEDTEAHLNGAEQARWFRLLEMELENFRSALEWTSSSPHKDVGRAEVGLRLGAALNLFWSARGLAAEGRGWLDRGLSAAPTRHLLTHKAKALKTAGALANSQGDHISAIAYWQQALRIYRKLGDRANESAMLHNMGNSHWKQNDLAAARRRINASLAIRRELNDKAGVASGLNILGIIARRQGDYDLARKHYEDCIARAREAGDLVRASSTMTNLGNVMYNLGDYARARDLHENSLSVLRALGNNIGVASTLDNLAQVLLALGETKRAEACFKESLITAFEIGARTIVAEATEGLAQVKLAGGLPRDAARLLGSAAALRTEIQYPVPPYSRDNYDRSVQLAKSQLGQKAFDTAWAEGSVMPASDVKRIALSEPTDSCPTLIV